jgi:hypothetical protein
MCHDIILATTLLHPSIVAEMMSWHIMIQRDDEDEAAIQELVKRQKMATRMKWNKAGRE